MHQLDISCHPVKPPVLRMGYKSPHGTPKYHRLRQGFWLFSTTVGKAPLLKTPCMSFNTGKSIWCLTRIFTYWLAFMVLEVTLHTIGGKRWSSIQLQTQTPTIDLPAKNMLVKQGNKCYGSSQQSFHWISGPIHKIKHILLKGPRTWD